MFEFNRHYTPEEETMLMLSRPGDDILIKELVDFWQNLIIRKYSGDSIFQNYRQHFYNKYTLIDLDPYVILNQKYPIVYINEKQNN